MTKEQQTTPGGITRTVCACAFALFQLLSAETHASVKDQPTVRLAVVNTFGNNFSVRYFNGTVNAIAKSLDGRRLIVQLYNQDEYLKAAKENKFDLSIASSGLTAVMMDTLGGTPLLTLVHARTPNPNKANGGVIIANAKNGNINSIRDLKGKSLVVMSKKAFAGYMIPMHELERQGLNPENTFRSITEAREPMTRLAKKVRDNEFDVAFLASCVLENMEQEGTLKPNEIKVINPQNSADFYCQHSTELYPGWILSARSSLPATMVRKIVISLLEMPVGKSNGEYWTIANDYQEMNTLLRRMEQREFMERDIPWLIRRYKYYILSAVLFLLFILANWMYLAYAVRKRTKELKDTVEENLAFERENLKIKDRFESLQRVNSIAMISTMVAHELKQPLAVINNYAEGLGRRITKGRFKTPQEILPIIEEIRSEGQRASSIIDLVRRFGKKDKHERQTFDLGDLTAETVDMLIRVGTLTTGYELKCGKNILVTADRLNIEVVIINLIKNAVEACRAEASPMVVISVSAKDQDAEIIVEDNGPEISDEQFEKMKFVGNSTKKDGLGLGLAIVHELIEAHGGSLVLKRKKEGGLICVVQLPRCEEKE